jgi:glutathione S-transferase
MDLYFSDISPPCRAVLLTAKALGIELNLKYVDILNDEHLKPDFVKVRIR